MNQLQSMSSPSLSICVYRLHEFLWSSRWYSQEEWPAMNITLFVSIPALFAWKYVWQNTQFTQLWEQFSGNPHIIPFLHLLPHSTGGNLVVPSSISVLQCASKLTCSINIPSRAIAHYDLCLMCLIHCPQLLLPGSIESTYSSSGFRIAWFLFNLSYFPTVSALFSVESVSFS